MATKLKQPTKATAKKSTSDLRKPQLRILAALAKSKRPLTRAQIAEKGKVDQASLTDYVGSYDDAIRAKNDKKICMSLVSLRLVKAVAGETGTTYMITAAGRKAVTAAK